MGSTQDVIDAMNAGGVKCGNATKAHTDELAYRAQDCRIGPDVVIVRYYSSDGQRDTSKSIYASLHTPAVWGEGFSVETDIPGELAKIAKATGGSVS